MRPSDPRLPDDAVSGIVEPYRDDYLVLASGIFPSAGDLYLGAGQAEKWGVRPGDRVIAIPRPARPNDRYAGVAEIVAVSGLAPADARRRPHFADLTPVHPHDRFVLEAPDGKLSQRLVDLVAPQGRGQRALLVSPPKAGKTTLLRDIAAGITANHPDVLLLVALIGERPEEVTEMERGVRGLVLASTFDEPADSHTRTAELAVEIAKRQAEAGRDVVILMDSLTRLARAYNLTLPVSNRTLSGGMDAGAIQPVKRIFGAARKLEGAGSLTIIATCLVDTGSRMDDVVHEELKGTGNSEVVLDRSLAEKRIFPSLDISRSSTRREELLIDPEVMPKVALLRRMFARAESDNPGQAMELLLNRLVRFETNEAFLGSLARPDTK